MRSFSCFLPVFFFFGAIIVRSAASKFLEPRGFFSADAVEFDNGSSRYERKISNQRYEEENADLVNFPKSNRIVEDGSLSMDQVSLGNQNENPHPLWPNNSSLIVPSAFHSIVNADRNSMLPVATNNTGVGGVSPVNSAGTAGVGGVGGVGAVGPSGPVASAGGGNGMSGGGSLGAVYSSNKAQSVGADLSGSSTNNLIPSLTNGSVSMGENPPQMFGVNYRLITGQKLQTHPSPSSQMSADTTRQTNTESAASYQILSNMNAKSSFVKPQSSFQNAYDPYSSSRNLSFVNGQNMLPGLKMGNQPMGPSNPSLSFNIIDKAFSSASSSSPNHGNSLNTLHPTVLASRGTGVEHGMHKFLNENVAKQTQVSTSMSVLVPVAAPLSAAGSAPIVISVPIAGPAVVDSPAAVVAPGAMGTSGAIAVPASIVASDVVAPSAPEVAPGPIATEEKRLPTYELNQCNPLNFQEVIPEIENKPEKTYSPQRAGNKGESQIDAQMKNNMKLHPSIEIRLRRQMDKRKVFSVDADKKLYRNKRRDAPGNILDELLRRVGKNYDVHKVVLNTAGDKLLKRDTDLTLVQRKNSKSSLHGISKIKRRDTNFQLLPVNRQLDPNSMLGSKTVDRAGVDLNRLRRGSASPCLCTSKISVNAVVPCSTQCKTTTCKSTSKQHSICTTRCVLNVLIPCKSNLSASAKESVLTSREQSAQEPNS